MRLMDVLASAVQESQDVSKAIDGLFERHGPGRILAELARRCREEAAIQQGEGRKPWMGTLAREIEDLEIPVEG